MALTEQSSHAAPARYDPVTEAEHLLWASEHYVLYYKIPATLATSLKHAAATLQHCVPRGWRTIAALEALLLLGCAWLLRSGGW